MAETPGESSDVAEIKQELEELHQSLLESSQELQDYVPSIDASASEAHSAVDGSGQQDVEELFALVEEAKTVLGEVASTAEECAQGVQNIHDRL